MNVINNRNNKDIKHTKRRQVQYYVNPTGIHEDIGKECKGVFFKELHEAFSHWTNHFKNKKETKGS